MASAFAHAALGATLGSGLLPGRRHWPYWLAAAACAVLPDADALGYRFGVPYASLWGHRGLTHSLLAAAAVAAVGSWLLTRPGSSSGARRPQPRPGRGRLALLLLLATASHGLLDALTTGGLGVAFLSPFDPGRYFFPFRPIAVSPLGVRAFFGARGAAVLRNEVIWVGLPCAAALLLQGLSRGRRPRPGDAGRRRV